MTQCPCPGFYSSSSTTTTTTTTTNPRSEEEEERAVVVVEVCGCKKAKPENPLLEKKERRGNERKPAKSLTVVGAGSKRDRTNGVSRKFVYIDVFMRSVRPYWNQRDT